MLSVLLAMVLIFFISFMCFLLYYKMSKTEKFRIWRIFFKRLKKNLLRLLQILQQYKIRSIIITIMIILFLFIGNLFKNDKIWCNIPPGFRGVVFNRFGGGMKDTLIGEGSRFYIPFFQSIYIANLTRQSAKIDNITADSKEFQDVILRVNVEYSLQEQNLLLFYRKYGMKSIDEIIFEIIEPNTNEAAKNIIIDYPVFDVLIHQSDIKSRLKEKLAHILEEYYITVYDVDIENILISSKFRNTVALAEVARKEKEGEAIRLEQKKIEAQRLLLEAENRKKIKILEAEAILEYNRLVSKQRIDQSLFELKRLENKKAAIEKWDGKLPVTTGGLQSWPFD